MDPFTTPDGVFRIDWMEFEMRMSHWVCNPRLTHLPSGQVIVDYFDSMVDGAPSVDDQGRLHLFLRTYPGSEPGTEYIYDTRDGTVTVIDGDKSETYVHDVLIKYATQQQKPHTPPSPPEPPAGPPQVIQKASSVIPSISTSPTTAAINTQSRPVSRWLGFIYPLIFVVTLPTILLAAWMGSKTTPFKRLPRIIAAGIIEILIIAALMIGGFLFMLWLYRGKRV